MTYIYIYILYIDKYMIDYASALERYLHSILEREKRLERLQKAMAATKARMVRDRGRFLLFPEFFVLLRRRRLSKKEVLLLVLVLLVLSVVVV